MIEVPEWEVLFRCHRRLVRAGYSAEWVLERFSRDAPRVVACVVACDEILSDKGFPQCTDPEHNKLLVNLVAEHVADSIAQAQVEPAMSFREEQAGDRLWIIGEATIGKQPFRVKTEVNAQRPMKAARALNRRTLLAAIMGYAQRRNPALDLL